MNILKHGLNHLDKQCGKINADGKLPYAYLLPKEKDPCNKDRPIMSYYNHPQKGKLNKAGRASMWILKLLQTLGNAKSFATFDTSDYVKEMANVTLPPHTTVYLGDVTSKTKH